jgi:hypothetical protein
MKSQISEIKHLIHLLFIFQHHKHLLRITKKTPRAATLVQVLLLTEDGMMILISIFDLIYMSLSTKQSTYKELFG